MGSTLAGVQASGAASSYPEGDSCHLDVCQAFGWCAVWYTNCYVCHIFLIMLRMGDAPCNYVTVQ